MVHCRENRHALETAEHKSSPWARGAIIQTVKRSRKHQITYKVERDEANPCFQIYSKSTLSDLTPLILVAVQADPQNTRSSPPALVGISPKMRAIALVAACHVLHYRHSPQRFSPFQSDPKRRV